MLERDSAQIRKLLASESGSTSGVGSITTLDNCQLMETVHENHASHLMPQIEQMRAKYEQLYKRCLTDKVRSTSLPMHLVKSVY